MGNIFWRISREKSKIGLTDHTKFTKYKETFQEHIPERGGKVWLAPTKKSPNFIRTKDRHRITYVLAR